MFKFGQTDCDGKGVYDYNGAPVFIIVSHTRSFMTAIELLGHVLVGSTKVDYINVNFSVLEQRTSKKASSGRLILKKRVAAKSNLWTDLIST